jgi:hypothetical protein
MDSRTLPVAGRGCAREQKPPSLTVKLSRAAARPNVGTSRAGPNECQTRGGLGRGKPDSFVKRIAVSRDLLGLQTTETRSNKEG